MKFLIGLLETEEPVNWENDKPGDVSAEIERCTRKMKAAKHAFNVAWTNLEPFELNNDLISAWSTDLASIDTNIHKVKIVKYRVSGKPDIMLVLDTNPNVKKIWPTIVKYAKVTLLANKQYLYFQTHAKELNKEYRKQQMALAALSAEAPLTNKEIADLRKTTPHIELIGGPKKKQIQNPLMSCAFGFYVGPPGKYPDLTGSQMDLYLIIENALKKAGMGPLTKLYGGRKDKKYPGINFVAVGADGKFAWRKYDPSPGSGQNWVYFNNGKSMKTSEFVDDPVHYLTKNII